MRGLQNNLLGKHKIRFSLSTNFNLAKKTRYPEMVTLLMSKFFIENAQIVTIYQNNSNHSKKQRTEETHMHGPKTQLNYN